MTTERVLRRLGLMLCNVEAGCSGGEAFGASMESWASRKVSVLVQRIMEGCAVQEKIIRALPDQG